MTYQMNFSDFPSYAPNSIFDRLLTCLNYMDASNYHETPKLDIDIFREARGIVAEMEREADPKSFFYIGLLEHIYAKSVGVRRDSYFFPVSATPEHRQLTFDFSDSL